MRRATTLLVCGAAVLALVLAAAAVRGNAQDGDGDGSPVIGVDAEGNLHINTTSSNTTVFVNGRAIDDSEEDAKLEEMVTALMFQQAALSSRVLRLCKEHGLFSTQQNISNNADNPYFVFAADLDGDGDMDVLSASRDDDKIAWYENMDGLGTFSLQKVISTSASSASSVCAADLDGDGDIDVLSASISDNKIAWYENEDGLGNFSQQKVITTNAEAARSVLAADIDGDGDMDVLSASQDDDKIAWYENEDGRGTFSAQKIITTSAVGAISVFAADIDGDGDVDVLSASYEDDKIAWYENEDGLGTFSQQKVITTSADAAHFVFAADLDGDGDMNVLSASLGDDKIAWYENEDGVGFFSQEIVIASTADYSYSVFAADLDGDGDMDVLSASLNDDKIAWYENEGGLGTFSSQKVVTTSAKGARSVFVADLDGDGDVDVLSASANDDKIAWYENLC